MELNAIHIICSIREDKPFILTDQDRETVLKAHALYHNIQCTCRVKPQYCPEQSVQEIDSREQIKLVCAKEKSFSDVSLGASPSEVRHTSDWKYSSHDSSPTNFYSALNKKSSAQFLTEEKLKIETHGLVLEGNQSFDILDREIHSSEGAGMLSCPDLWLPDFSHPSIINLNDNGQKGEMQQQSLFLNDMDTNNEEIQGVKNLIGRKKVKTKSIFHHLFALEENFQPFSFVFGETLSCKGITPKASKKSMASLYSDWRQQCVNKNIIENCAGSPNSDTNNECSLPAKEFPLTPFTLRRHSVDSAQFNNEGAEDKLNCYDCYCCSPLNFSGYSTDAKSTGFDVLNDKQWQKSLDSHSGHSHDVSVRRYSDGSANLEKLTDYQYLSENFMWNDQFHKRLKEGRLSLLGHRLVKAFGLRKQENAEAKFKIPPKYKPKKAMSSDFIPKECPQCKMKRSCGHMNSIKNVYAAWCQDIVSVDNAKALILACHEDECLMSCIDKGNDFSKTKLSCDKVVCLDLPLTNFGFYSGEMMILM